MTGERADRGDSGPGYLRRPSKPGLHAAPRLLHLFDVYAGILQIVRIDILDLPVICLLVDGVSSPPHGVLRLAVGMTKPNLCASYDVQDSIGALFHLPFVSRPRDHADDCDLL